MFLVPDAAGQVSVSFPNCGEVAIHVYSLANFKLGCPVSSRGLVSTLEYRMSAGGSMLVHPGEIENVVLHEG